MEITSGQIRQFFLENISSQEREEIELSIISRTDFADEVEKAETDLIEDYLDNSLSTEEKKLFESNFLISEDRQKRVEFLKTLKNYAKKCSEISETPELKENPPSFFDSLKNLFTPKVLVATFGLIIVFLGLVTFRNVILPTSNSEIVAMNQKDLSKLEEFKDSSNLTLTPGNLRSTGTVNILSETKLTETVLIRLALSATLNSPQTFQVKILKNEKELAVFNQNSYQNQEVRIILPKSQLSKGEYQITLEKETEKYNYYFVIN